MKKMISVVLLSLLSVSAFAQDIQLKCTGVADNEKIEAFAAGLVTSRVPDALTQLGESVITSTQDVTEGIAYVNVVYRKGFINILAVCDATGKLGYVKGYYMIYTTDGSSGGDLN